MRKYFQKENSKTNLSASKTTRSKTKSPINLNKKSSKISQQSARKVWQFSLEKLPNKEQSKKVPQTKNQQDEENHYQYRDELKDLLKRSTLSDMQRFLGNLIKKSRIKQLSNTEKYMLGGYIDIYIKQNYVISDGKDNSTLSVKKLKNQWERLCQAWKLYKIKVQQCNIGNQWQQKQERKAYNFDQLYQQMQKIDKKKQKLQPIKKLMKKFYAELIS